MIEIPWFIYFYVPRCAACPRMVPIWEDISREHDDIVNIAAINGYLFNIKKLAKKALA